MDDNTAYLKLRAYADKQRSDVTVRKPQGSAYVVFDWTAHTMRARGTAQECCAQLGIQ
jgi:hypothetical protein